MATEWRSTAEVTIIGGGIMGASVAFHLAQRGCTEIVLLEKDLLAQASTGLSAGGIRQQFSHPANILLSQESVHAFATFEEEVGPDIGFRRVGYLFLAQSNDVWQEFLVHLDLQHNYGVPVEALSPAEIGSRWPFLRVSDLSGGTFCADDGFADPYLAAMGYANAARRLGACICEQTTATGIRLGGDHVVGVETTRGLISSPFVVNVAGAWGGQVARTVGLGLPVLPYRRQVFVTRPTHCLPKPVPMILDIEPAFYFRGEGPGLLMGMSDPSEPSSFNTTADHAFLGRLIDAAVRRAPVLEEAQVHRGWGGLYAITPDSNPIIDASLGIGGFVCAIGFSGHGFQHAPAVGRILSELILDEKTDFDISPFKHDRFGEAVGKPETRVV